MKKWFNKLISKGFFIDEWRIGMMSSSHLATILETKRCDESLVEWLNLDGNHFQADPFLCEVDQKLVLLYESMSNWNCVGKIIGADLLGNLLPLCQSMTVRKGHQSFPFTLNYNDEVYCLPETAERRELNLFKYSHESKRFEFAKSLMSNANVVDSFIYEKDKTLYLFCTHKVDGNFIQRLYFSSNFEDKFVEHPCSPIATGKSNGRNAGGVFCYQGNLFRVSQECSRFYGEGINFHKIETLNPIQYADEFEFCLEFTNSTKQGYHTFTVYKDWIFIDGKSSRFSLLAPLMKLRMKLVNWSVLRESNPHHQLGRLR